MSAFVAPLIWIKGKVRNVVSRDVDGVPAVEATPAQYDEQGRMVREARPAKDGVPGYTVHDVLIDTHQDGSTIPAGLIEVVITDRYAEATGGYLPSLGDDVEWPVRGYTKWVGSPGRRRATNGYSFAGDVYAAAEKSGGRRSATPLAAAN